MRRVAETSEAEVGRGMVSPTIGCALTTVISGLAPLESRREECDRCIKNSDKLNIFTHVRKIHLHVHVQYMHSVHACVYILHVLCIAYMYMYMYIHAVYLILDLSTL